MARSPEQTNTATSGEQCARNEQRLLKLFIASFEHSQGFQQVQINIFRFLGDHYPDLQMSVEMREQLIEQATGIIFTLLGVDAPDTSRPFPHKPINEYAVLKTVAPVAEDFHTILNETESYVAEAVVADLTRGLIARDHRYLVEQRARTARRTQSTVGQSKSRLADPYFSYVCFYALRGQSTGLAEFDAMYRAVGVQCQEIFAERADRPFVSEATQRLEQVVAVHNRHHPHASFALPGAIMKGLKL